MCKFILIFLLLTVCRSVASDELIAQRSCPYMGSAIRSDMYVDTPKGRVYTCCKPCLGRVESDLAEALKLLSQRGERLMTPAEYQQRMQHTAVPYTAVLHDVFAKKYHF